jgi:type I restriction enzyme R subunit
MAESLAEEELAVFDLLTRQPDVKLTQKQRKQVKQAARDLLAVLKAEKLTLDWRKRQQSRAAVRVAIEQFLDERLPEVFTPDMFLLKCEAVYHTFSNCLRGRRQHLCHVSWPKRHIRLLWAGFGCIDRWAGPLF